MSEPLFVEVVRSGIVESVHPVDAVVVDPDGRILRRAGDPERIACFRSSFKPLQAAVCLDAGWVPPGDECLAVACGSHNGEPGHTAAVRRILADAGLDEAALRCPPALPFEPDAAAAAVRAGGAASFYHNCSGKHAAMVAASAAGGWGTEGYPALDHPLQRAIQARFEALLGQPAVWTVDGCGVPSPAAPLAGLARAFLAGCSEVGGARAAAAMRDHPFHVGGTARSCTALMEREPDLVVKGGAEGLACVAFPGGALALKVRDGAARARDPALLHALRILGFASEAALEHYAAPPVLGGGRPVGSLRVRGHLA